MLLKKRFLISPWSFDEDKHYTEVLGSGQSDEEEGAAEYPEFTALRQSKGSAPPVAATSSEMGDVLADVVRMASPHLVILGERTELR